MARDKVASESKPAAQLQGSSKEAGRSAVEPQDCAARAVAQWATEFPDWELAPMEALGRLGETATIIDTRHISPLYIIFD